MAGTRLVIQSVLLIQLLGLLALSVYFGLYRRQDLLFRSLIGQEGRYILQSLRDIEEPPQQDKLSLAILNESLKFPPVTFVSADSQVMFYESALVQDEIKGPLDHVSVQSNNEALRTMCDANGQLSTNDHIDLLSQSHHVWLCETIHAPTTAAKLSVRNGTMILYARGLSQRMADLKALYPIHSSKSSLARRKKLTITVSVGRYRSDWKVWIETVHQWLNREHIQEWPCWMDQHENPIQVNLRFFDLSEWAEPTKVTRLDGSSRTLHHVLLEDTQRLFATTDEATNNHPLAKHDAHIHLFLPSFMPTEFFDGQEHSTTVIGDVAQEVLAVLGPAPHREHDQVASMSSSEKDTYYFQSVDRVLKNTVGYFLSRCMGLPEMITDIVDFDSDGSLPRFYSHLWYQRTLSEKYAETVKTARYERQLLLSTPRHRVAITEDVSAIWMEALEFIRSAQIAANNGQYKHSLERLDAAVRCLRRLQTDPELVEPLDYPMEQYGAIFAPLLLPLLLPLVLGWIRELKRYKTLLKTKIL